MGACLSFFSLFFCFDGINCYSVSYILLSICFFFSLLYALCLSLFNILILFKRFFISLGIFFFFPSLFLFGTISIHISYIFSNRYSITSIAFPLLHIFLLGISFINLIICFQSNFLSAWKFNDLSVLSTSCFFLLIFSSFILYVVVISILLWSDMADVFTSICATIPISFVYTKSSVFSFLGVSSMICIKQCSSHISLNLLNCNFSFVVAFDIDLISHMHPPLSILFHITPC